MKRIAIFCDGTWNRHDAANPTNVVRLAQAVKHTADDGHKQQIIYISGVGGGEGVTKLSRILDTVLGGALGWGLGRNIAQAYLHLIFCYEPGDEIYLFGFSRGAYTARSLAGLLRSCGIPPRSKLGEVEDAIQRYRSRDKSTAPDDPQSFLFRRAFAPYTATSDLEWKWRHDTAPGMCVKLEVKYLGVWDTVGALGVPSHWALSHFFTNQYQFHDADLTRMVKSARHALAIDEHRKTFPPALWSDKLDGMNRAALGLDEDTTLHPDTRADWAYRQEWFPGDHGSVGGGGDRPGLSAFTFDWIARGAERVGLCIDQLRLDEIQQDRNIREALINKSGAGLMAKIMRLRPSHRDGPTRGVDVSQTTLDRIACDPTYQPKTLAAVLSKLQEAITKDDLLPPDQTS